VFFGYAWLNPAFWTLAIELQYYLLIGLLFPLISCRSLSVRMCAFCGLTVVALSFPFEHFLLGYLFLFMFGMAAFQFRAGLLSASQFAASIALLALGAWHVNGPVITIAGVAAAATIGFIELGIYRPLVFFGQISYSLYLLHVPIGGRVINLGARFAHTTLSQLAILTVALAASTAASWLLYEYVERPSQRWSSAIQYRTKRASLRSAVSIMPASVESLS
jgi:peptidoglycan/LPS O-acetylase OafA/YrhL